MNYLDYVQMTTGQKISYKIKSFFTGIPGAIATIFRVIGLFFKSLFVFIGNGFKNYGKRFSDGDAGTKLSYIIMGAGSIMHKQIGKGLVFLAAQIGYIVFMVNFGSIYLSKIYCNNVTIQSRPGKIFNGVVGSEAPIKKMTLLKEEVINQDSIDDSNKILLFFCLTIMVTIAFFAFYIMNTKSAYASEQIIKEGKQPMGTVEELKMFLDDRFHVTLLSVPITLLLIFNVLPIIFTVCLAFTNYDEDHLAPGTLYWWVGFKNFADVFYSNPMKSETFGKVLLWTLVWAVFATFSNYILGIILALMINKKEIKFKGFWRTMFVITAAVPQFVTLLVMRTLLDDKAGFNALFGTQIPFLSDVAWARVMVIVVNIWVGVPYTMLISSGLLMNIPEDLYESARIDGANAVQQFTKITFPYIFFVTTPYLITTFVGNINNFNVIFFLTRGGPNPASYYRAGQTDLLVTWLYELTVETNDFNLAAVIGIFVFVVCASGSLITFNMSKSAKNEEEFS